jgi:hypothetical protein
MERLPMELKEWWGVLSERPSGAVNFCNADLRRAELENAVLDWADFSYANLSSAKLSGAELRHAELKGTILTSAQLNGANLSWANLDSANLEGANLDHATLSSAVLTGARLVGTSVKEARLSYADLSNAMYIPRSQPPYFYVAGGLETVITFSPGGETGLVQLRDLIQKAGLRDLEREATFAIESGRTRHSIDAWRENPGGAAEGIFRKIAFELTTRYGLHPVRALLAIAAVWMLLIPVYAWPVWRQPPRTTRASAIYRVWPKDRVELRDGKPTLDNPACVERLHARGLATVGWSAYFSLLSAFQIGFREFSVGTWLTRAQPRIFLLEATGWVRTLSGLQSLLSVYLLAMWLLTYFGRPFQ